MRSSRKLGWVAATGVACGLLLGAGGARAGVVLSLEEALRLAFPEAERVVKRQTLLGGEELARAEKLGKVKIESRLWTFYVGYEGGKPSGYAVLDTHVVKTLPETVMVVLDTKGRVRSVRLLAFYEPSEYMPSQRWLDQFRQADLGSDVRPGSGIQGITGATLSARSLSASVRRALAIYRVGIEGK